MPVHRAGLFYHVFKDLDFFFCDFFILCVGFLVSRSLHSTSSLLSLTISGKDKRRGTIVLGPVFYKEPTQKPRAVFHSFVSAAPNSKDTWKKESWC